MDSTERGGSQVSPRFGLVWTPHEGTTIKLVAGQAFRAPNAYEAYYYLNSNARSSPVPESESTQSMELIWEQKLASNWNMKLTGYTGRGRDLVEYKLLPNGDSQFANSLNASFRGVEAELHARFRNGLEARLGYSVQDTKRESGGGQRLSNSPQQLAKLHVSAPISGDRLSAAIEVLGSSSVTTQSGNSEDAYWVANFHLLSVNLLPGFELSAGVYNLFDQHYANPSSGDHSLVDRIEQDGRTFGFKGTYRF